MSLPFVPQRTVADQNYTGDMVSRQRQSIVALDTVN
jgi:hypothetical protein